MAGSSDYPRSHRVADHIQRELSELIRTSLRDPRVSPMLTLSSVEVSSDLSSAKIYYTLFDAEEQVETQAALVRATGFLRRQLARQLNTRTVPLLRFYYDDSSARGAKMSALIDSAVKSNTTEADMAAGDQAADNQAADNQAADDRAAGVRADGEQSHPVTPSDDGTA